MAAFKPSDWLAYAVYRCRVVMERRNFFHDKEPAEMRPMKAYVLLKAREVLDTDTRKMSQAIAKREERMKQTNGRRQRQVRKMYKAEPKHNFMDATAAPQPDTLGVSRMLSSKPPREARKTGAKKRKSAVEVINDKDNNHDHHDHDNHNDENEDNHNDVLPHASAFLDNIIHDLVLRSLVQLVAEARSAPSLSTIPGVPFSVTPRLDRLYSFRQGWRCAGGLEVPFGNG